MEELAGILCLVFLFENSVHVHVSRVGLVGLAHRDIGLYLVYHPRLGCVATFTFATPQLCQPVLSLGCVGQWWSHG